MPEGFVTSLDAMDADASGFAMRLSCCDCDAPRGRWHELMPWSILCKALLGVLKSGVLPKLAGALKEPPDSSGGVVTLHLLAAFFSKSRTHLRTG